MSGPLQPRSPSMLFELFELLESVDFSVVFHVFPLSLLFCCRTNMFFILCVFLLFCCVLIENKTCCFVVFYGKIQNQTPRIHNSKCVFSFFGMPNEEHFLAILAQAILAQATTVQDGIARACSSVALLCCCALSATAVHGSQQEVGFGGQFVRGSLEDDFEGSTSTIRDIVIEQVFSQCSREEVSQSGAKERQRQGSIQGCRPASAEPRGSQAKPQPRRAS